MLANKALLMFIVALLAMAALLAGTGAGPVGYILLIIILMAGLVIYLEFRAAWASLHEHINDVE